MSSRTVFKITFRHEEKSVMLSSCLSHKMSRKRCSWIGGFLVCQNDTFCPPVSTVSIECTSVFYDQSCSPIMVSDWNHQIFQSKNCMIWFFRSQSQSPRITLIHQSQKFDLTIKKPNHFETWLWFDSNHDCNHDWMNNSDWGFVLSFKNWLRQW